MYNVSEEQDSGLSDGRKRRSDMNVKRFLGAFLVFAILFAGCTEKKEEAQYDINGKTYYNTIEEYGNESHSRVWFGKDGSFTMKENAADGTHEFGGKWALKENVLTLESDDSIGKIVFEVQDNDTIVLRTSLYGSRSEQVFSTTETTGPTGGVAPSAANTGKEISYAAYYDVTRITSNKPVVQFKADGTFHFDDVNDYSIYSFDGTYEKTEGDGLLLSYTQGIENKTISFTIVDNETLVLNTDVGLAVTGDVFSTDYEASAPTPTPTPSTAPSTPASVPCTGISLPYSYYWATEGLSPWKLEVTVTPSNTTDKITYKSNDETVVRIDENGYVSALSPGNTTIDITCGSQKLTIKFETRSKGPKDISFKTGSYTIMSGNYVKLEPVINPSTANQTVSYRSDDPVIATVNSDGIVTGINPGQTKVYGTTVNGLSTYATISVEGERIVFEMQNYQTAQSASNASIYFTAYHISQWDGVYNKEDVRSEVELHTSYPGVLTLKDGVIKVTGSVTDTTDILVYFTWTDGSSLKATSDTYYVRVTK